jgi:MFS family permease
LASHLRIFTESYRAALGLHRNVAVLAASLFGLALGEELWQAYVPIYLTALGAGGVVVGLFGSLKDLLDSAYQYPGGWLADRIGRRRALLLFTSLAMAGYLVYAIAPAWPIVFAGLFGVMAWKSGAFPTTFAVIGDSLPRERRAVAFGVQSVLVRVPRVIGAPIGGLLIASVGSVAGIRAALIVTIVLAAIVLVVQWYGFREEIQPAPAQEYANVRAVFRALPTSLKRLLTADCIVRIGEGIAASFIVLYVTSSLHYSASDYGVLYAVQQTIAILFYLPAGRLAALTGRRPLVLLTFVFFSAFPLAVRLASTFPALLVAFVIGGLKEFGEPARKSLIVDLAPDHLRGRAVGVYYGIRNLLVVPAGLVGGLLWQNSPALPLEAAAVVGAIGTLAYAMSSARETDSAVSR